jgi:long-chain acyl-CoA synthetase
MTEALAMDLWTVFRSTAAKSPTQVAVETGEGDLTFAEVVESAERLATRFRFLGIEPGSVVHLALPNGPEFLPTFLALRSMDVVVGLVSARYRDAELRAVTARMPPHAFVTSSRMIGVLERAIDVAKTHPVATGADESELEVAVLRDAPVDRTGVEGLALVKFTSGSSGAPKGVGLTEQNLLAEALNLVGTLGITATDRILAPVPVSHSYGFDLALLPVVLTGARAVLRRSFIPREVLRDLAHPETSVFLGVPSMYRILSETDPSAVPDLSHVRYMLSCTAPLLPSLVQQCYERLGVPVCQHYGSSETGAATNHRPADVLARPGSVGLALHGVEVRILDDRGLPLPPGQEGEIAISSRAVARGYVTDEPHHANEAFVPGQDGTVEYRTGDLGVIDEDGFVYWQGRGDMVINVGGLKVYPSEVVQVLERCPSVSEARVFSAHDHSGEEVVHAAVTIRQSTREQDILAFCRRHLADYKVPRVIEIVESMTTPEAEKMSDLTGETS